MRLALIALISACAASVLALPQGLLPVELSDQGYLRVNGQGVKVPIGDAGAMYSVGEQISLIEATRTSYVALGGEDADHQRICVFPRRQADGQGTAWITEQHNLIFGTFAESVPGELSLRPTEILPVIFETDQDYQVLCERNGNTFSIVVQKGTPGVTYYDELPTAIVQRVRQRDLAKQRLVPSEQWNNTLDSDLSALTLELDASPVSARHALMVGPQPGSPVEKEADPEPMPLVVAANPDLTGGLREFVHRTHDKLVVPTLSKVYPVRPKPAPAVSVPEPVKVAFAEEELEARTARVSTTPPPQAVAAAVPGEAEPEATESPRSIAPEAPAPAPVDPDSVTPPPATPEPVELAATATAALPHAADSAPDTVPIPTPAVESEPAPAPEPIAVVEAPPPAPILHTTILPSDAPPPKRRVPDEAPQESANTVAQAALKLLLFMAALTFAFIATILLLAKFMNRGPKARRIQADQDADRSHADAPHPPQLPTQPPPPPAEVEPSPVIPGADDEAAQKPPDSIRPVSDPSLGTFTGSLDGFSILELIQYLHVSRETGTLYISEPASPNHSSVLYDHGEIVHATCSAKTGEPAIEDVLSLRNGFFVFQRQSGITAERTIHTSTMSLLMNCSTSIDETPVGSHAG